uniref:Lipoprotein n=1 Tax=Paenibacillus polymyxa TaxID=1406 RepID=A0AAE9TKB8_PAEPO
MKTSSFRFIIVFLLVPTLLSACSPSSSPSTQSIPSKEVQSSKKTIPSEQGQYLSMTYTEYMNGKNTDKGMVMRVMTYDLSSKKMTKLADVPYTSQYPLSVVSLPDHKIYYSADVDDKGDQLFSYDLNSKKLNNYPIIYLPLIV